MSRHVDERRRLTGIPAAAAEVEVAEVAAVEVAEAEAAAALRHQ